MSEPGNTDRQRIEAFVRDVLGCTCPDAVFDDIRLADPGAGLTSARRVYEIGGRLIVAVFVASDWHVIAQQLGRLVAAARQYRDQHSFNRFRLVVACGEDDARTHLPAAFGSLPDLDDKVHLHVIAPDVLPFDVAA